MRTKSEMSRPLVKGKLVYLRYPLSEDFEEFTASAVRSAKFHRRLVNPPQNESEFADYLSRNESDANENLLVCRVVDDAICGTVNLSQIFRRAFQNCYLGYYLFADFTGHGLMTEAVKLVLRFAFNDLKLHRVEANVQPENKASIAVLNRCGFTKEGFSRKYLKIGGRWRDHERFAIVKEDWTPK